MPVSVASLPVQTLDYTRGGPGLHVGMTQLEAALAADRGRDGHLAVHVTVPGAVIQLVMARSDLYILGFRSNGTWFRFDDHAWPFAEIATPLGHDGRYADFSSR